MRAGPGTKAADHPSGQPPTPPAEAARDFTQAAIDHAGAYADNATVLIADLG